MTTKIFTILFKVFRQLTDKKNTKLTTFRQSQTVWCLYKSSKTFKFLFIRYYILIFFYFLIQVLYTLQI